MTLPVPPSVNQAYRNVPKRGRVKTKAYKAWLAQADIVYLSQKRVIKPMTGPCELHIRIPASTRGDASNKIKLCEDFLVSREITGDDRHNHKVTIERDAGVSCCVITITQATTKPITPRKLNAHLWEANEHYVEPEWYSQRLFEEERFGGTVWDPCCGSGRIPEAARAAGKKIVASDLIDRGYSAGLSGQNFDFLQAAEAHGDIVCNPPFAIAPQFALHALNIANKVAMVFPTARLHAAHWLKETPLTRVWLLLPRPSMPPGHVIARGEKPGGGKMDYCWLVWERGHEGWAETCWLYRDKAKQRRRG